MPVRGVQAAEYYAGVGRAIWIFDFPTLPRIEVVGERWRGQAYDCRIPPIRASFSCQSMLIHSWKAVLCLGSVS